MVAQISLLVGSVMHYLKCVVKSDLKSVRLETKGSLVRDSVTSKMQYPLLSTSTVQLRNAGKRSDINKKKLLTGTKSINTNILPQKDDRTIL